MHKHEINFRRRWRNKRSRSHQYLSNFQALSCPPASSWHQAKTIPIKAVSHHENQCCFPVKRHKVPVLKYVAKWTVGRSKGGKVKLLSVASFPPIPLWADRHIWSARNRISWWLVTLATVSQKLHVLRSSIVPLAAASLEWIFRPNLHIEGEVIAVTCTGLRVYL